tara:strand:- start:31988 stop:33223 length:1236 start_codon:yes stop_codon:yes gene_type:complete
MTGKANKIHPYLLKLLELSIKQKASDLHLKAGIVPVVRRFGNLRPLAPTLKELSSAELDDIVNTLLDEEQRRDLKNMKEIDMGYGVAGLGRFRFSIFKQRGSSRMVCRTIPYEVPRITDLNLPPILQNIANLERGLILCTGITGAGKSSTLAAIVNQINHTKNKHIVTIEDPIEYLIRDKKSIITQRELGIDTTDYKRALRSALRQDPDVILIGELRDRETIETAISAAETGHLVISTLHTMDARETIYRILNVFPPEQQAAIRIHLASVLKAVISQRLATRKDGRGFVPACEVMIVSQRIREMIEDPERTGDIPKAIAESKVSYGMQTFDQSLIDLLDKGWIDMKHALEITNHPEDFKVLLSGVKMDSDNRFNSSESNDRMDSYLEGNKNSSEIEFDFTNAQTKSKKRKF